MQDELVKRLMNTNSIDDFFSIFFGLDIQEQLSVVGDDFIIPEGTILYRARKDVGIPLLNELDWWMPPESITEQGRFNCKCNPVLYLGTFDFILPREIGLDVDDTYYLAKYRVKNSFSIGSLLKNDDIVNYILHKVAMAIEDDSKLRLEEKNALTIRSEIIKPMDFANDFSIPYYLHSYLRKNLYDITNKVAELVLIKNPYGIRYCSCYTPIEMSGGNFVLTLDGEMGGNYALTYEGIANLEWISAEKKVYTKEAHKKDDMSVYINIMNELSV